MARLIKTVVLPCFGPCFFLLAAQQLAAQQSVGVPSESIRIVELGLEDRLPSAVELVGPESESAERNRGALVHRLRCWVDAIESCTTADLNDPRVRALRRFLATRAVDRNAVIVVDFPDQTRVDVRLARVSVPDPNDWGPRVYELVVLQDTVRAQGQPRYTRDGR